jgi:hypothetical protein
VEKDAGAGAAAAPVAVAVAAAAGRGVGGAIFGALFGGEVFVGEDIQKSALWMSWIRRSSDVI